MLGEIIAIIALIITISVSIILLLKYNYLDSNIKDIVSQMNEFNRKEYDAIQRNAKEINLLHERLNKIIS